MIEGHLQYKEITQSERSYETRKAEHKQTEKHQPRRESGAGNGSSENNKNPCWTSFQQIVYDTAKATLGKHEKKHQDWFNPYDLILLDLMAKRDQARQRVWQIRNTRSAVKAYKDACRILQRYTRARKSEWWEMKTEELQRAAGRNDMKDFYSGLKEVSGPQTQTTLYI